MDVPMASSSKTDAISQNQVSELQVSGDFAIKSEAVTPKLGQYPVFSRMAVNCLYIQNI